MADWLHPNEAHFTDLCRVWDGIMKSETNITAYGWSIEKVGDVLAKIKAYLKARDEYLADKSTVKRRLKEDTKERAIDAMRAFANGSIRYNDNMTPAAKLTMGVKTPDTIRTPRPRPSLRPDTLVNNTSSRYDHQVTVINPETGTKKKPLGVDGVYIAWQLGGERPESGEDLPKGNFSRSPVMVVSHGEKHKGKSVWYSSCYDNGNGVRGDFSPIVEAIVG